jgi:hypothetical protein
MPSSSTSFYNNYYLEDNSKKSIDENILKNDFTLDYTDYQKLKTNEQYNKLYSNTYEINKENNVLNENNKIFNFVSSDFFRKAGKAYISIMNDFVLLEASGDLEGEEGEELPMENLVNYYNMLGFEVSTPETYEQQLENMAVYMHGQVSNLLDRCTRVSVSPELQAIIDRM